MAARSRPMSSRCIWNEYKGRSSGHNVRSGAEALIQSSRGAFGHGLSPGQGLNGWGGEPGPSVTWSVGRRPSLPVCLQPSVKKGSIALPASPEVHGHFRYSFAESMGEPSTVVCSRSTYDEIAF